MANTSNQVLFASTLQNHVVEIVSMHRLSKLIRPCKKNKLPLFDSAFLKLIRKGDHPKGELQKFGITFHF